MTDIDEILLNSMPNSWSKQTYVQGSVCDYITLEKDVNMLENMDISEYIYEGVVEPYY